MIDKKSARRFCCEDLSKIENYQEAISDMSQTWDIHHRRETTEGISGKELIRRGEYFHRCASELIFLTKSQHHRLHWLGNKHRLGKTHTAESRKKMSRAHRGENNGFFGKRHTTTTKKKISEALSGEKNIHFGTRWYTDGVKNVRARSCPDGFVEGRLPWKKVEKRPDVAGEGDAETRSLRRWQT